MPRRAWVFIGGVFAIAAALIVLAHRVGPLSLSQWELGLILTILAAVSQCFKVEAPKEQTYFASPIFFFAAVLLLEPTQFVWVVTFAHLVEWAKERWLHSPLLRSWYGQPFNIAKHVIAGICASLLYTTLNTTGFIGPSLEAAVAVGAAALTYVVLNQVLMGCVLMLARKVGLRESGVLDRDNLMTELVLVCIGIVTVVAWQHAPWLIVPTLAPLLLIYRALAIHQLKVDAQTDAKTGLWNARHFAALFASELERSRRFDRPLAVIMADLDLLRNINNTYGHLAGDTVLAGIGKVIKETVRDFDIASRFGGEEFAIVMPEVEPEQARLLAERIREAVEGVSFEISTSPVPIHVTMSLGVACFPQDATTANDLIHEADVAVYQAKILGRNQVAYCSDVPHSIKLEHGTTGDRLGGTQIGTFIPRPEAMNGTTSETYAVAQPVAKPMPVPAPPMSSTILPVTENAPGADAPKSAPATVSRRYPAYLLKTFVGVVVLTGTLVTAFTVSMSLPPLSVLALLTALVILAEMMQVSVYGDNTMSISVALLVTAAIVVGLPGLAVVAAAIALTDHFCQRRSLGNAYKTAFNWATHLLSAAPLALVIWYTEIPPTLARLPELLVMTSLGTLATYAIETGLISTAIGLAKRGSILETWQAQYRWLMGHYLVLGLLGLFLAIAYSIAGLLGMLVFMFPVGMMRYAQKQYIDRTESSVSELKRMNRKLGQANQEIVNAHTAIKQLNNELFRTVGDVLDARDPYVAGHARQVADYATAIAVELGLNPGHVEIIRQAGFLHDLGKIAIPEHVLHKPAKLTDAEYELIKTHAVIGGELLEHSPSLSHLAPFVRAHHERWDGKGYPDLLAGEQIPLEARILNVCDSVEAMASDRPYKKGMSTEDIIAELRRCAGTQFDPVIAEAFMRILEREGARFVINSALEVERKHVDPVKRSLRDAIWSHQQLEPNYA